MSNDINNKKTYIKYFSNYDGMCEFHLKMSETIILNFDENKIYKINEIIELYNIKKYFNNERYSTEWDLSAIKKYTAIVDKFDKTIFTYFSQINKENIESYYTSLHYEYYSDFWELFNHSKLYKKISKEDFYNLLCRFMFDVSILYFKDIVDAYHHEITLFLNNHVEYAFLLVDQYIIKHDGSYKKIFFPNEYDKTNAVRQYINFKDASLKYIGFIGYANNNNDELVLTDEIRLLARNKYNEFMVSNMEKSIKMGYSVFFDDSNDKKIYKREGLLTTLTYGTQTIEKYINQFEYSLIYVFANVFDFIDKYGNFFTILSESDIPIFQRVDLKGRDEYDYNDVFKYMQSKGYVEVYAYDSLLQKYDLSLEILIGWYFNNYVENVYKIKGFNYHVCTATDYYEKARNIAFEMEGILKQFDCYAKNDYIDQELLKITKKFDGISSVKSLYKDKYIVIEDDRVNRACYYLCSDQSPILYIERIKKDYSSLCELLEKEKVSTDDYSKYGIDEIKWLEKEGYIIINDNNDIIPNWDKIEPLMIMYKYGAISKHRYNNKKILEHFSENIKECGTLFTPKEQDYLNFYLNDKKFSNGFRLRNLYGHPGYKPTEKEAKTHYYILLMLMILVLLKINDELCLLDENANIL